MVTIYLLDFYAPEGRHIVIALSVSPSVRQSVIPSFRQSENFVQASTPKPLGGFHSNFTGMIVTKPSCAPCQEFLLKLFLTELCALDCHFYYIFYIKILSELHLLNHWGVFIETSQNDCYQA